jgi:pilus assembly protein CpaB
MRSKTSLIVSIGLGVLAMLLMYMHLSSSEAELLQLAQMKDVLVARVDILPNSVVDERLVQPIQVPAKYLQPLAVSDLRSILGRVLSVAVPKGAQILASFLEGGERSISYDVPRGRRAVALQMTDITGVGGLIQAGNFVDILGTFEFGRPVGYKSGQLEYADERTETRVLLQNVPVIAVNKQHSRQRVPPRPAEQSLAAAEGTPPEPEPPKESQSLDHVTVMVDPLDAQKLVLAQKIGSLTLMLRSSLDTGQLQEMPLLDPLGLLGVTIPLKPKSGPSFRELRGGM